MSLRGTLSRRLQEVWSGNPWYGDSSAKILDSISAAEAAHRVTGVHSIWEIVLHMTAWTEEVGARVRGAGAKAPDRGDWPPVAATTAEAWDAALHDLGEARRALLAEIESVHEEDLHLHVKSHSSPFTDTGSTRAHTLNGLVEHDAYHLGQVALLKKAVRARQ